MSTVSEYDIWIVGSVICPQGIVIDEEAVQMIDVETTVNRENEVSASKECEVRAPIAFDALRGVVGVALYAVLGDISVAAAV